MFQYVGCLFIFLFGIFMLIVAALRNIYDAAFGRFSKKSIKGGGAKRKVSKRRGREKRIFTDDIGEYVDYEDVK